MDMRILFKKYKKPELKLLSPKHSPKESKISLKGQNKNIHFLIGEFFLEFFLNLIFK